MKEQLLEEIFAQNRRLQQLSRQMKAVGYYLTSEFFYHEVSEQMTELELVQFLVRKSVFYDQQYETFQQSDFATFELFELLGEAAPEEVLGKVYEKKWVHDWMDRVKEKECTVIELLHYLRTAEEEAAE